MATLEVRVPGRSVLVRDEVLGHQPGVRHQPSFDPEPDVHHLAGVAAGVELSHHEVSGRQRPTDLDRATVSPLHEARRVAALG